MTNIQVIFLFVLILEVFALDLKENDRCITPNGENGTCIQLKDCAVIYTAISTFDTEAFQFAQKSRCGPGLVCCGSVGHPKSKTSFLSYTPKISATPAPQEEIITLSKFSDQTVCGLDVTTTYKIKGGLIAQPEEFPWLAALEYISTYSNKNVGIRCGGSLINDRYVLTAAHCIVHVEFVVIKAWLGVTNITSNENCLNLNGNIKCINSTMKVNVEKAIPHELYHSLHSHNDIGLLRLENRIKFTDYIRPICLPSAGLPSPRIGCRMMVAGWGVTEDNQLSDIKLKVEVPVKNNSICNNFFEMQRKKVGSKQLCAGGERGKDSCQGDSGGPLMRYFSNANNQIQWYQEGIVSYGVGCGIEDRPSVYTRVSEYVLWIVREIYTKRGSPCTTPDGKTGTCVLLDTCQVVYNAMSLRNSSEVEFAIKSNCEDGFELLVCCESPGSVNLADFEIMGLSDRATCGIVKEESRIFGGQTTELGKFPWMAALEYLSKYTGTTSIRCGGSLINSRYVLTAATCISAKEFKLISVWLGEWKISTDPDCVELIANTECADPVRKLKIMEQIPHPFYNRITEQNNIGLLLLENDAQFTDYISPICLPSPNLPPPKPGTHMTVAGWGTTENGRASDVKLKVELPIVSSGVCYERYSYGVINSQQLCAGGEDGKDSCAGDWGQPLMRIYNDKSKGQMQWYQDGIVSWSLRCGKIPAVYTRVAEYMSWIAKVISERTA